MKLMQPVYKFDVDKSVEMSLPAKAGQGLVKGNKKDVMNNIMKTKYQSGIGKL
jgi:hypothetical protein